MRLELKLVKNRCSVKVEVEVEVEGMSSRSNEGSTAKKYLQSRFEVREKKEVESETGRERSERACSETFHGTSLDWFNLRCDQGGTSDHLFRASSCGVRLYS